MNRKYEDEVFLSVDIEADGPIPGDNSMLSFGVAAFTRGKELIGSFERNLEVLPDATPDASTTAFWQKNPEAYAVTRENTVPPLYAFISFKRWLASLPGVHKYIMLAYPAGFDFTFMHWYSHHFMGYDPVGFSCLDVKTYAMAVLKTPSFRKYRL